MIIGVTGASGFVGSALVQEFDRRNCKTVAISRSFPSVSRGEFSNVRFVSVDDIEEMFNWRLALSGIDVLVHCAAAVEKSPSLAKDDFQVYRRVNVDGTRRIAFHAAASGVKRLVYVSSVKAVGDRSELGKPFQISDIPAPSDAYGDSKYRAEIALHEVAHETGLEVVVIRPPLIYGPKVKGNFARLIRWVASGLPLPLGSVNNLRSMVYTENLADFVSLCALRPDAAGRTFFVSDGDDLSTPSLIRKISFAAARPVRLLPVSSKLLHTCGVLLGKSAETNRLIGTLQVDISANREFGWVPPYSVDVGLRSTVNSLLGKIE